ncbi:MAG: Clp protease ClpP [Acidaminococcaceae bacterium]|nr:Clp protease ClpP [Acidaminococcaceae bacterium]
MNPIRINRQFYTMATTDGTNAEITMYGEIVEQRPKDWWTDEPIDGDFIVGSEFLEDLKQIENCSNITIRMNSGGGDAATSILIHNRLRELAKAGKHLTCIVDGIAMSGGSLIMCACDTVKVHASSLIMIHKCWSIVWGAYNADELRKLADSNDAYDKIQASIYVRKTGKSETQILHMMSDTTYMTGREAIDKGFANELTEAEEPLQIAASANRRTLYVGQRKMHLAPGMILPDSIPTVETGAVPVAINKNQVDNNEGGTQMANTIEELRAEYPDLVAQLAQEERAAAVQEERSRIRDIDDVAGLFPAELVTNAKYGENICTAQELAYRAAQAAKKNGSQFLSNMAADAHASGAAAVPAAPVQEDKPEPKTPEEKMAAARAAVKALLGKETK